ncbi:MAG: hypothetical protein WBR15_02940 [Gammaproteobacteria bacterium]
MFNVETIVLKSSPAEIAEVERLSLEPRGWGGPVANKGTGAKGTPFKRCRYHDCGFPLRDGHCIVHGRQIP